jgi:4'-phosphopantetheinyl transferase
VNEALERLASGEVHVYCASVDPMVGPDATAVGLELLDARERSRYARLVFQRDRRVFLAAHTLVRRSLSSYAAVAPRAWTFAPDRDGKPQIAGPCGAPPLTWNLSHTAGFVACIVALDRAVGIDAESLERPLDVLSFADACLAPGELAALRSQPPQARVRRFLELWTLKEAYLKARGVGLSVPTRFVAFDLEAGRPVRAVLDPRAGDVAARWRFLQLRTASHVLAAAVERCGPDDSQVRVYDGGRLLRAGEEA